MDGQRAAEAFDELVASIDEEANRLTGAGLANRSSSWPGPEAPRRARRHARL